MSRILAARELEREPQKVNTHWLVDCFQALVQLAHSQNAEKALRKGTLATQATLEWWLQEPIDSTYTCVNSFVLVDVIMANPWIDGIVFFENFAALSHVSGKPRERVTCRKPVPHTFERDKYHLIFTDFICTTICVVLKSDGLRSLTRSCPLHHHSLPIPEGFHRWTRTVWKTS